MTHGNNSLTNISLCYRPVGELLLPIETSLLDRVPRILGELDHQGYRVEQLTGFTPKNFLFKGGHELVTWFRDEVSSHRRGLSSIAIPVSRPRRGLVVSRPPSVAEMRLNLKATEVALRESLGARVWGEIGRAGGSCEACEELREKFVQRWYAKSHEQPGVLPPALKKREEQRKPFIPTQPPGANLRPMVTLLSDPVRERAEPARHTKRKMERWCMDRVAEKREAQAEQTEQAEQTDWYAAGLAARRGIDKVGRL